MLRPTIAGMALLALCGCGDTGAQQQNMAKVEIAIPASDHLKGMTELYRYLGLRRAIVDSGLPCKKVDAGAFQQNYKNLAMWTAHCTDTGNWAIFIAATDDVQVRRCDHEAQLGLPECRMPPVPAGEEQGSKPKTAAR